MIDKRRGAAHNTLESQDTVAYSEWETAVLRMNESRVRGDHSNGDESETVNDSSYHYPCRARRQGWGDSVVCLEEPPHFCGYALHLGEEYLCLHPDHLAFADQTAAGQPETKVNPCHKPPAH